MLLVRRYRNNITFCNTEKTRENKKGQLCHVTVSINNCLVDSCLDFDNFLLSTVTKSFKYQYFEKDTATTMIIILHFNQRIEIAKPKVINLLIFFIKLSSFSYYVLRSCYNCAVLLRTTKLCYEKSLR